MISVMAGLSTAAILFIVSVGLSLIFGTMRIINLAHGTFYMLGAYLATVAFSTWTSHTLGFGITLLLSSVTIAILGIVVEMFILRRLYKSDHLLQLLSTWALMIIMEQVAVMIWGPENATGQLPPPLSGAVFFGNQVFPRYYLFLIVVAILIAVILWFLIHRTRLGRLIRAAVQDIELIGTLGVNIRLLYTQVFAIGIFLAALGGALMGPATSVGPGIDINITVEAFIVSVIGGLGNVWGAALGALMIGLFQSLGNLFMPEVASLAPYVVMILVLVLRPQGILGKVEG